MMNHAHPQSTLLCSALRSVVYLWDRGGIYYLWDRGSVGVLSTEVRDQDLHFAMSFFGRVAGGCCCCCCCSCCCWSCGRCACPLDSFTSPLLVFWRDVMLRATNCSAVKQCAYARERFFHVSCSHRSLPLLGRAHALACTLACGTPGTTNSRSTFLLSSST